MNAFDRNGKNLSVADIDHDQQISVSAPVVTVEWRPDLQKIKEESNELSSYFSRTYKIHSFVFVLELYPKRKTNFGDEDNAKDNGATSRSCIMNLHLVKVPYNVGCVALEYR